jgi:hypothetical protein
MVVLPRVAGRLAGGETPMIWNDERERDETGAFGDDYSLLRNL